MLKIKSRKGLADHPAFEEVRFAGGLPLVWRCSYYCRKCVSGWTWEQPKIQKDQCETCRADCPAEDHEWIGPKDPAHQDLWRRLPNMLEQEAAMAAEGTYLQGRRLIDEGRPAEAMRRLEAGMEALRESGWFLGDATRALDRAWMDAQRGAEVSEA